MRRVIAFVASQFRKDKIWMRRTRPDKRKYQVLHSETCSCAHKIDSDNLVDAFSPALRLLHFLTSSKGHGACPQ